MWTDKDREKYKDDGRRYPSDLTDAEWDIIKPLFMGYFTFTADMREVVNACFYLEHTGCQWRALPTNFGPHQTVRTWYDRFRTEGVWAQAAADLTRRVREAHGHGAEPTTGILDSQSVVSGPQQGERGFDGNKKIKGIKRHVLSCSLGFVLAVVVTPASDTKAAELVLDRAVENGFTIERAKVASLRATRGCRVASLRWCDATATWLATATPSWSTSRSLPISREVRRRIMKPSCTSTPPKRGRLG
jgi:putative transposase